MHRREFVFSAGAALSAATLASGLGAALAQEAPATPATPEPAAPAAAPKPFGFEDVAEMARIFMTVIPVSLALFSAVPNPH